MDLFCEIDQSGDGVVDLGEFRKGMQALGLRMPKSEMKALFALFDRDRSGFIEYNELSDLCKPDADAEVRRA